MPYQVIKPNDGDDPTVIGEVEFVDGELQADTDSELLLECVERINAENPREPDDTDDIITKIGQSDKHYDHTEDTAIYRLGSRLTHTDTDLTVREK